MPKHTICLGSFMVLSQDCLVRRSRVLVCSSHQFMPFKNSMSFQILRSDAGISIPSHSSSFTHLFIALFEIIYLIWNCLHFIFIIFFCFVVVEKNLKREYVFNCNTIVECIICNVSFRVPLIYNLRAL